MSEEPTQNLMLPCVDCPEQKEFLWPVGEQKFFQANNLMQPKRCKEHRAVQREKIKKMEQEGKFKRNG